MQEIDLGIIERVPIKQIENWQNEDDLSRWLNNHLDILGAEITNVNLEKILDIKPGKVSIGKFYADIVCKNADSDNLVLIENQLGESDHKHIGQLLTYSAGYSEAYSDNLESPDLPGSKSIIAILIAEKISDEHRATLDWLNEETRNVFFFGAEIELWKIGDSKIAPKFNIVCQPNEWKKVINETLKDTKIGKTGQLQLDFWTQFAIFLNEENSPLNTTKPNPQNSMAFWGLGDSSSGIYAGIDVRRKQISVSFSTWNNEYYDLLTEEKDVIQSEIGESLNWLEKPNAQYSHINITKGLMDITDRQKWPDMFSWLKNNLEIFHFVFSEHLRKLKALSSSGK